MFQEVRRVLQIDELRAKIVFTILVLIVCRIGGFIPVPGINGELALKYFKHMTGGGQNFFQMIDIFSGGAFSQMTVVALGVGPYILASIMMQLVVSLWPSFQREIKESSEAGKRKLQRYTRFMTLILSFLQASVFARFAIQMNYSSPGIINPYLMDFQFFGTPWLYYMLMISTMTTGTLFLMWLGDQISEKGIGNGVSLIITLGILSQLPTALGLIVQMLNLDSQEPGSLNFTMLAILSAVFVTVVLATIQVIQGHRRVPLQHARRIVGRKEVQGGNSYIPLKINYAGVMPVIFASSILLFPATFSAFLGTGNWLGTFASLLSPGSLVYTALFVLMIVFFTYFWTATQFHPDQIASEMKKSGAFVPGVRQGKPTQDYLESTMHRVTLFGAIFLAIIAVLPTIVGRLLEIPSTVSYFFGGTTLLILVGVVLDTMKQIESHLLMKRYDGFMKRGRIRGR